MEYNKACKSRQLGMQITAILKQCGGAMGLLPSP